MGQGGGCSRALSPGPWPGIAGAAAESSPCVVVLLPSALLGRDLCGGGGSPGAQEAGLAGRAENGVTWGAGRAAQEVAGLPGSSGVTDIITGMARCCGSCPCGAGTWDPWTAPLSRDSRRASWDCFLPVNVELGEKLERSFQAWVQPEEHSEWLRRQVKPSPVN